MAERLGTGLQNLLQRFDSAWHLLKALTDYCEGFFCPISYTRIGGEAHKKKRVGLSQADALTNHIINNTKTNNQ